MLTDHEERRQMEALKQATDPRQANTKGYTAAMPLGNSAGAGRYDGESDFPRRPSIRMRVEGTLRQAQQTFPRIAAAQRVKELMEKHPEVVELLDLLNEF